MVWRCSSYLPCEQAEVFRVISVLESSCTVFGDPRMAALICIDKQIVNVKNYMHAVNFYLIT